MKALVIVVVVALLAIYLVLSLRKLWHSVRSAMNMGARVGGQLSEPFSKYPPLPADPPLASPFEEERRVAAWQDLRRVHRTRTLLRNARMRRATSRWQAIDPQAHPYSHLDRKAAKKAWTQRRGEHAASSIPDA